MEQLPQYLMDRKKLLKAVTSNIRLKHSLEADQEINEKLPAIEREIEAAFKAGKIYELDIKSVLESS